jgi:hypothetical protein
LSIFKKNLRKQRSCDRIKIEIQKNFIMQQKQNIGELAPQKRDLTSLEQLQALQAQNLQYSDKFVQRKASELLVKTRLSEMRKYAEDGIVQPEEFIDSFDHLTQEQKEGLKNEYKLLRTRSTEEKLKYFKKKCGQIFYPLGFDMPSYSSEISGLIATSIQYGLILGLPTSLIYATIQKPEIFVPAEVATVIGVDAALKYRKNTSQKKLNKQIAKALTDNPIPPTPEI